METNKTDKETHCEFETNMQQASESNRRNCDRRKEDCEGFTYVSTVGWICRREKSRRKDHDDLS